MKLQKLVVCFAAVAAIALSANVNADELGGNLSFEGPFGAGDPALELGNWHSFANNANGAGTNTIDPLTGAVHGQMEITGVDGFAGLQQQINATAGEAYTFSFFGKSDGGAFDVGTEYRIEWLDAGGAELSRSQLTNTLDVATYSPFSVSGTAPLGTTALKAVVVLQSFQGGTAGLARIDDTSIQGPSAVPEPGSLALLGLGALGLMTRRRRS